MLIMTSQKGNGSMSLQNKMYSNLIAQDPKPLFLQNRNVLPLTRNHSFPGSLKPAAKEEEERGVVVGAPGLGLPRFTCFPPKNLYYMYLILSQFFLLVLLRSGFSYIRPAL